jgi:hypothetical protein
MATAVTNSANSAKLTNVATKNGTIFSSDTIKKGLQSNMGIIVIAAILFMVLIYVILYIYRKYNETSLKTVTVLKKPLKVSKESFTNISSNTILPELYNGNEFSYSFWVYIDNENFERTTRPKLIMGRMSTQGEFGDANPVFYLDPIDNKMHVFIRTDNISSGLSSLSDIHGYTQSADSSETIGGTLSASNTYKPNVLTLNYMPLQRWVNVILVVDNNFVQLFVDGDLREVKDLSKGTDNKVVTSSTGNLVTGGDGNTMSFDGFLSKVQAFNYAVTIDHAKIIYKAGPLHKSILSMIGVPYYGVRSPFYRVDEVTTVSEGDDV